MLLELALFIEVLATDITRELVAYKDLVDGGQVSFLVLGDLSAQVAHPGLQRDLHLSWCS